MSAASRIRSFARTLFRRGNAARDAAEELRFHIDAYTDQLVSEGVARDEARRRAQAQVGDPSVQGERHRDAIGLRLWDEVWSDVRYGLRSLWRNPGFATITILSLALGIGTATAMFSVIYAVVLDVYPYADNQRTVNPIVSDIARPQDWDWFLLNRAQFDIYRSAKPFEDAVGVMQMNTLLDEDDVQSSFRVAGLTPNANSFFRVPALIGRMIEQRDGEAGAGEHDVLVLSYKYWVKQYGGDKGVLHKQLKVGDKQYEIVGVMPPRFTLNQVDAYMPVAAMPVAMKNANFIAFAKLKPGISAEQASAEVDPMVHEFAKENPRFYPKTFHVKLQLLIDGFTTRAKIGHTLPLLFLAVTMLLLIGCANCSILLMARGTARVHEFAVRAAVGASRARIIRQLLIECMTISLIGSAVGVVLSYYLARLPLQLAPDLFPSEAMIRVKLPILAFSVAVAIFAGVLFGLLPALKFSKPDISGTMKASGKLTCAGGNKASLGMLIGGQIALTLVMLTVAGAAISGYLNLSKLHLGYNPTNTTFASVGYPKDSFKTWPERVAASEQFRQRIAAVPGVVSVTFADDIPPSGGGAAPFEMVGGTSLQQLNARMTDVGANYFSTLEIPLLQGRVWTDAEREQGLPLAVVNEAFVRRYSADRSILDRTLRFKLPSMTPAMGVTISPAFKDGTVRIVGVVGDAINDGLDKPVLPNVYINSTTLLGGGSLFIVRTHDDPESYVHAIQHAIRTGGMKPYLYVSPLNLQEIIEHEPVWRQQRLIAALFGIFALIALLLALVGLYSVVAYVVEQRTGEFGIRMAIGAQRIDILWLVLRSNTLIIWGGAAAGLAMSLLVRREFQRWSEDSSRNPAILFGAAALMVLAAYLATLIPARRAALMEPCKALRSE